MFGMEQHEITYARAFGLVRKYAKDYTYKDGIITFATKSGHVHHFDVKVVEWFYGYLVKARYALENIKKGDTVNFCAGYDRKLYSGVVQKVNRTHAVGKFPIKSVTVVTGRFEKEERLVCAVDRQATYYHWLPICYWHSYACLTHKLNCITVCYNEIEKIYNELKDNEEVLFLG